MRTTLTLDDDLMDRIRHEAAERRRPFREVLNERLRLGFAARDAGSRRSRFRVEPFKTAGFAPGVDEEKLNQLADAIDTEARRP
jgi:hypothetical protein